MADIDDLEKRVKALEDALTYQLNFTGPNIDAILERAKSGGDIDLRINIMQQTALDSVTNATNAGVQTINTESENAIRNIYTAAATAQAQTDAKGREVIASIPEPYTDTVHRVSRLETGLAAHEQYTGAQLRAHDTRLSALETTAATHTRKLSELQALLTTITTSPLSTIGGDTLLTISGNTIDARTRAAKAA